MAYQKIKQPKIADVIEAQLESMILEGSLNPGQKLPPERELAKQFDVSRPSLREAIQRLEARGLLTRRHGGGTFVGAELRQGLTDPLYELLNSTPESQYDLLEFRHALEGISAFYAALRGTEADFSQIRQAFADIEQVQQQGQDLEVEAKVVVAFYLAIVESSHNLVLMHLMRGLLPLLEQNVLHNLQQLQRKPEIAKAISEHRRMLLDAILGKAPKKARDASDRHLVFIEETLLEISREENRLERSLRRVQQPKE
ncbi:pyruvate dehydrogenase complex transcriptional repressor PdhR [Motilimonas eburnea]|uniref:pyruvate dehydrogenase complex transcriptional repressor PdhR n=1 Tax=Motilimonas eburnea TaxID=1737488 RepID=UPI001E5B3B91|nr:pyruvate dehydrogenase complex transcriptional repressor PdhR [Motilimonas eburnea]MCE2572047.1 pyruvate dehydrogenase complex transcriptional repressor PdhR [Motilimonas eburnea]